SGLLLAGPFSPVTERRPPTQWAWPRDTGPVVVDPPLDDPAVDQPVHHQAGGGDSCPISPDGPTDPEPCHHGVPVGDHEQDVLLHISHRVVQPTHFVPVVAEAERRRPALADELP